MKIFVPYRPYAVGGPMTFLANFKVAMAKQGHQVISTFQSDFNILFIIESCHLAFALYAKLRGRKIIQRLDGVYYPALPGFNGYFHFFKNLRLKIFHNYLADHVIYQSQFARKSCQAMLGERKKNISIIYNGAYTSQQVNPNTAATGGAVERLPARGTLRGIGDKQVAHRAAAGKTPGVDGETPGVKEAAAKLTTFASFRRPDQIKPILESIKHLAIPYHLHIYGSHTTQLSPLFQSLSNNPRVTYHGSKKHSQLLADIQRHDIFLFSDQSACPNAVLEALAAGLPVVAFNRGSIPELLQPGSSGEVVSLPPHNPFRHRYPFIEGNYKQFARAIERMAPKLNHYRAGAIRQARQKFNPAAIFFQYEKVLT